MFTFFPFGLHNTHFKKYYKVQKINYTQLKIDYN